jgi:hypothetical protein
MSFAQLRSACDAFRGLLRESTGRELIHAVSVDEPKEPHDELHFMKLLSWCYVFIFEASQPSVRYILSLLRTADPNDHKVVTLAFENVNNLRTVRVHSLSPESKRDDYKKRQAQIWLVQNGGNPTDWASCCSALCGEITSAVHRLAEKWIQVTASSDDTASVIQELTIIINREWPPHAFDRIIESAATDIGLLGLDCVRYRESRLDRWRELASFFESREHAQAAMNTVIRQELKQLFGGTIHVL